MSACDASVDRQVTAVEFDRRQGVVRLAASLHGLSAYAAGRQEGVAPGVTDDEVLTSFRHESVADRIKFRRSGRFVFTSVLSRR
jgi:hypothetical protein